MANNEVLIVEKKDEEMIGFLVVNKLFFFLLEIIKKRNSTLPKKSMEKNPSTHCSPNAILCNILTTTEKKDFSSLSINSIDTKIFFSFFY